MSNNLKAIPTTYKGITFRSKLEAKWAVVFDELGVKWRYEAEGYELPSGNRYLPDFLLECYGTRGDYDCEPFDLWVEVKGIMTESDAKKIREFVHNDGGEMNPVLILGDIPYPHSGYFPFEIDSYDPMNGVNIYQFNYETIDGDHFGAYPAAHNRRFYLMGDEGSYINDEDLDLMFKAYKKARDARFE